MTSLAIVTFASNSPTFFHKCYSSASTSQGTTFPRLPCPAFCNLDQWVVFMEDWKVGDRETRVFLPWVVLLVVFQTAATSPS